MPAPILATSAGITTISGVLNTIAEVSKNKQLAKTERFRLEKESEIILSMVDANLEMFRASLEAAVSERGKVIDTIYQLALKDDLTDNVLQMCDRLIDMLSNPQFSLPKLIHFQATIPQKNLSLDSTSSASYIEG